MTKRKLYPSLLMLMGLLLSFAGWAQPAEGEAPPLTEIHSAHGDVLITLIPEPKMFPKHWYRDSIHAQTRPLKQDEVERSALIVERCLAKYPDSLLQASLTQVYVLESLRFFGTPYGGTYANKKVFLTNKGAQRGYSDHYIEKVFHAEFSSVLLQSHADYFDKNAWRAANVDTFSYGPGSGVLALKNGTSSEMFRTNFHEMGLLNQYAMSSLENDFNAFAKNIFLPTQRFWYSIEQHPRLQQKLDLVVAFYHRLDPHFTLEYFQGLTVD